MYCKTRCLKTTDNGFTGHSRAIKVQKSSSRALLSRRRALDGIGVRVAHDILLKTASATCLWYARS